MPNFKYVIHEASTSGVERLMSNSLLIPSTEITEAIKPEGEPTEEVAVFDI